MSSPFIDDLDVMAGTFINRLITYIVYYIIVHEETFKVQFAIVKKKSKKKNHRQR